MSYSLDLTDRGYTSDEKFLPSLSILLVEDSEEDAEIVSRHVGRETHELGSTRVESREEMVAALEDKRFDIVLCDHNMPEFDAFEALDVLKELKLELPFIIVTGAIGGEEIAVKLMRSGASDYVPKGKMDRLVPAIRRQLEESEVRRQKKEAVEALASKNEELLVTVEMLEKTQEQLSRGARLKGLGQMAAGVVNDFNNFLTKIVGIIEIVEAVQIKAIAPYMDQLKAAATDATSAVKRLRYFYEVSSEAKESESVDLNVVIAETLELTRPRLRGEYFNSNAAIRIETELGELPLVVGEPSEFREVLTNLIFNSCDAMPNGGTILITSSLQDDCVVLEIKDNGSGMTAEVLDQCLDPFFSTKNELGTGLGLALADGLMQRYGGVMRMSSIPCAGTTVELRFMIAIEEPRNPDCPSEFDTKRLKIMIVDDEKEIGYFMTRFLERDNHYVEFKSNSREALERIREGNFDLIIADRAMPDIGGDELARRVKTLKGNEKFIMATGFGDLMLAASETPDGVDMVLPKPVSQESLRRALEKVAE